MEYIGLIVHSIPLFFLQAERKIVYSKKKYKKLIDKKSDIYRDISFLLGSYTGLLTMLLLGDTSRALCSG